MTVRLLAWFWVVMVLAALATDALFNILGATPTGRPQDIVPTVLAWNYTTILNLVALGIFAYL